MSNWAQVLADSIWSSIAKRSHKGTVTYKFGVLFYSVTFAAQHTPGALYTKRPGLKVPETKLISYVTHTARDKG